MKLISSLPLAFYSLAQINADEASRVACNHNEVCVEAAKKIHELTQKCAIEENQSLPECINRSTSNTDVNVLKVVQEAAETVAEQEVRPRFGLKVKIPIINNYGCWCYGGEHWPGAIDTTGRGPHMDLYDDACKAHHMGFDCIVADAEAEGKTCIPNETKYSLLVSPQANGDYILECHDDEIDDWCKKRTCMVDLRFIARHWKLEDMGVEKDYAAYGHAGYHDEAGAFDDSVCLVPKNPGPGNHHGEVVKQCCGDYPYRIWFDSRNSHGTACCEYEDPTVTEAYGFFLKVGRLYNDMAGTCCSYGVIKDTVC